MKEKRNTYKIYAGKPEEMRRLGRLGCIWEDDTKMDHKEILRCLS
jgi:hypothetical protein